MIDTNKLKELLKNKILPFNKIARSLGIPREANKELSIALLSLVREGELFQTREREYYIPEFVKTITGIIRVNPRGFGFVDIDEENSTFVTRQNINSAMNGDEVEVKVFNDIEKQGQFQGQVSKIIKRNKVTFVGRVSRFGSSLGIKPLDASIRGKFRFIDTSKIKLNQEVKVKIVSFGEISKIDVIKILGFYDDVSIDILSAIEDADIPYEFSGQTIKEATEIDLTVKEKDLVDRKDLRQDLIVTIDGDDTKDFDDAIEIHKLDNGNFRLGVHIADVTYYVKEDKPLDNEAKVRGTSVYLADRVIPMLPKELSNGICSLNPKVDRLTMTADIEISPTGETVDYKIYQSVINSKYRLTYQEVNKYYRSKHSWEDNNLHKMLDNALELSKIMRKFKQKQGYIDFEIEESKIVIGKDGKTQDIVPRERLESEMMIEDFMVRANEVVAHHAEINKLSFIYRVHDKPDLDRVINLQNVVKILGMEVTIPQHPIPREFAKAINQIKKTRFDDFMKIMMLRTMSKAYYSPTNIGHFGLASKSYTHFTSPIRRYPDLMVHRMLREYFIVGRKDRSKHFGEILPEISEHSSLTEQKAMDLERRVADIKKAEFYEQFVGQSFEGTIVSIIKYGFFVEFPNKVDGLVHVSSLMDGKYNLADSGYTLTNGNSKYTVGDKIEVTVVGVIKNEGKIDLVITGMYQSWKKAQENFEKNRNNKFKRQ